jgi:hypothetical protein
MATLNFTHCTECKYYLKISHEYCYHPDKFGTPLENSDKIPAWCPLKAAK